MDDQSDRKNVFLLRAIEKELDSLVAGINDGHARLGGYRTHNYILLEIGRAATESCRVVKAYDEGQPMPAEVRTAVASTLHAASNVLGALARF
jgi:hypothetical protein